MPAPRAVLTDLEEKGLNPRKAHKDLSDDGHLKSSVVAEAPAPKRVVKKVVPPKPKAEPKKEETPKASVEPPKKDGKKAKVEDKKDPS